MIVVVGLAFEARIAAACGFPVICSGDGQNLGTRLKQGITAGCTGLISFGIAGGLSPELSPGTCVVGSAIVAEEVRWLTDRTWSQKLLEAMPGAVHGTLAGTCRPVCTPAEKRALNRDTGAVAVDTESHVVADVAARHGLPMAIVRVVADPAGRGLPEAALRAIRADGTTDALAVLRSLVRRPRQMPALLRTALDARAARTTLLRARHLIGRDAGTPAIRTFPAALPNRVFGELSTEAAGPDLRSAMG